MAEEINSKILLTDLQSFGSVGYYIGLELYEKLRFEQYEHFVKGSYSNRYYIAGPNGRLLLSIPLLHSRRERTPFKDLKICNRDRWQTLHWKTLMAAYRRSPWFEFYEYDISLMYNKKYEYLIDWNVRAFELVSKWLGILWETDFTESYEKPVSNFEMEDRRHLFVPPRPGGNSEEEALYYPQVFEDRNGFLPNLSILDLLFCEGKNAGSLLKSAKVR